MKILFIWPNQGDFSCKPIGVSALIAVLRRAGHEVRLFDTTFMDFGGDNYNDDLTKNGYFKPVDWKCDVEKKPTDLECVLTEVISGYTPDVVMMSVLSDEVPLAAQIVTILQDLTPAHILVGNKGAEKMSQVVVAQNVSFFIGEALNSICDYEKFRRQRVVHSSGYTNDLDGLPVLDWSQYDDRLFLKAYDGKVYRGGDHMIGWGCVGTCSYCVNEHWRDMHGGMRGCLRHYSVKRVIDEIEELSCRYSLGFWKFHDEDMLLKSVPYMESLVEQYKDRVGLPFTCMTNARSVTPDKARLLKEMGCVSVSIGIEAGDPVMRQVLRRRETPGEIVAGVRLLHDNGIRVSAFNMIGLPFETEATIEATIDLNRRAGIRHPNISLFMPLEGTKLYDLSVAYGFYKPGAPVSTSKPSLMLPMISEEKLLWYYKNFHRLVTEAL